jgi:hypothetical protein
MMVIPSSTTETVARENSLIALNSALEPTLVCVTSDEAITLSSKEMPVTLISTLFILEAELTMEAGQHISLQCYPLFWGAHWLVSQMISLNQPIPLSEAMDAAPYFSKTHPELFAQLLNGKVQ